MIEFPNSLKDRLLVAINRELEGVVGPPPYAIDKYENNFPCTNTERLIIEWRRKIQNV